MVISSSMTMVQTELAAIVLLGTTKLLYWKKLQRNTAAKPGVVAKKTASDPKSAKHDPNVATTGHNAPLPAPGSGTLNAQVGVAPVHEFTNTLTVLSVSILPTISCMRATAGVGIGPVMTKEATGNGS